MKILAALLLTSPALAEPVILPLSHDASVIRSSYALPLAADVAFGSDNDIKVGRYHLEAEGLLKIDLSSIQDLLYRKSELVITHPRVVGSVPAPFHLTQIHPDWDEASVTWNTKPDVIQDLGTVSVGEGELRVDITEALNYSRFYGHTELALSLASGGSSNLFFASREGEGAEPSAYVEITPFSVFQ